MVYSRSTITEMRKSTVSINALPVFNVILLISIVVLLAVYIIQANLIYGSGSIIERYTYELRKSGERYLELNTYANVIYDADPDQIKQTLKMIKGERVDSIKVDPAEVAVVR